MSMRLFTINLIFDQVIACKDNTQIKHFISESLSLTQHSCSSALSIAVVTSLLTSIRIRLLIYHDIELLDLNSIELILADIELELLVSVDVKLLSYNSIIVDV